MTFIRKLISIPSGSKSIEGVELWEVRWRSAREDSHLAYTREHMEAFPSEAAAREFVRALDSAFALLKSDACAKSISMKKVSHAREATA